MKSSVALLLLLSLLGCSAISPYSKQTPVDEALKACGLGYSAEVGGAFKAAYQYAENSKGLDFEAKMKEGLETQVISLAKSEKFIEKTDSKDLIGLVTSTQECVIKYTKAFRPKSRSEILSDCMLDLEKRVTGNGKQVAMVKDWVVLKNHPKYSDENPVISVTINNIARQYDISVQCLTRGNSYYDLEAVKDSK
jgi:hypothetical protein